MDRQYSYQGGVYIDYCDLNSPVDFCEGHIFEDEKTHESILILKLYNLTTQIISDLTFSLTFYDYFDTRFHGMSSEGEEMIFTFSHCSALPQREFGADHPIRVMKKNIKSVTFKLISYTCEGKIEPVRHTNTNLIHLPMYACLTDLHPVLRQKIYGAIAESEKNSTYPFYATFIPVRYKNDYWICSCGRINRNAGSRCQRCRRPKQWQFDNLSLPVIKKCADELQVPAGEMLTSVVNKQQNKQHRFLTDLLAEKKYQMAFSCICLVFVVLFIGAFWGVNILLPAEPTVNAMLSQQNLHFAGYSGSNSQVPLAQLSEDLAQNYPIVKLNTSDGEISFALFTDQYPISTANFIKNVNDEIYKDQPFYKAFRDRLVFVGSENDMLLNNTHKNYDTHQAPDLWCLRGAVCLARDDQGTTCNQLVIINAGQVSNYDIEYMIKKKYPDFIIEAYKSNGGIPQNDTRLQVIGQVVQGMDKIDAYSRLSTSRNGVVFRPPYIRRITVTG